MIVIMKPNVLISLQDDIRHHPLHDCHTCQLVARLNEGQYMAFGLSGEEDRSRFALLSLLHFLFLRTVTGFVKFFSRMVGGDVTVAWMDHKYSIFILLTPMLDLFERK